MQARLLSSAWFAFARRLLTRRPERPGAAIRELVQLSGSLFFVVSLRNERALVNLACLLASLRAFCTGALRLKSD